MLCVFLSWFAEQPYDGLSGTSVIENVENACSCAACVISERKTDVLVVNRRVSWKRQRRELGGSFKWWLLNSVSVPGIWILRMWLS